MIKIMIEGNGAKLVQTIVAQHLRENGLNVSEWYQVKRTKKDIGECIAGAKAEKAAVLVMAMVGQAP